jgi:hypothetical protein
MPPGGTWPAADALTQIEFGLQASKKVLTAGGAGSWPAPPERVVWGQAGVVAATRG